MANSFPSKDPANEGSLEGAQEQIFRKQIMKHYGRLPAQVVSYDRVRNVARVQPMIDILKTDGTTMKRASIAEVPVLALGGGGVTITFDLQPGDLGWIDACARDISLFMQSLRRARPQTLRLNALEDSQFTPDTFRQYTLPGGAAGHACIQSVDGGTFIVLRDGHVSIETGGTVDVKASAVNVQAAQTTVTGNVTINGTLTVGGVIVNEHTHPGVMAGPANTGPMQ